jgi:hypothetical protein
MNNQSEQIKPAKRIIKVQSKTHAHIQHQVRLEPDVHCTCTGFYYKKACSHLDEARRIANDQDRLLWLSQLMKISVEEIEANLQRAKGRGGCGQTVCTSCCENNVNGCPRTATGQQQQIVTAIHGYLMSLEAA